MPTIYPFEAVVVAALTVWIKVLELEIADRANMDKEQLKRMDEIKIKGLERIERILSSIEALGK